MQHRYNSETTDVHVNLIRWEKGKNNNTLLQVWFKPCLKFAFKG